MAVERTREIERERERKRESETFAGRAAFDVKPSDFVHSASPLHRDPGTTFNVPVSIIAVG